jgi:hypothetical protein
MSPLLYVFFSLAFGGWVVNQIAWKVVRAHNPWTTVVDGREELLHYQLNR